MVRLPAFVGVLLLATPAFGQFVKGDLYVGSFNNAVYRIDSALNVTTFADASDGLNGPSAVCFSASDTLLVSNYYGPNVLEFDSGGNGTVLYDASSGLLGPFGENGIALDANLNLFVSDFMSQQIFEFPAGGGAPSVFADTGDGIAFPDGLAFAANGDLFVANRNGFNVLRIDPAGNATVFDTLSDDPYSIVVRGNGDIYVATYVGNIYRYPGGDPTQRYLFAVMATSSGNPALQIGLDDQTLYYTSNGTGNLLSIDADTGAKTLLLPRGSIPGAISIVVYGIHSPASWTNYGAGFPGTNGVPGFTASAPPVLGTTITIVLQNSLGQPTAGIVFAGFQRIDIPSSWGGHLLADPAFTVPVSFSYGDDSFNWDVPNDPALMGLTIDLQAIEADPGAAKGVSFTAGLELVLGR